MSKKGWRVYALLKSKKTLNTWHCQGFFWNKNEAINRKNSITSAKTKLVKEPIS